MTTVEQDRELAQADGLLDALRAAEAATVLTACRSLIGEPLPPALPTTAAELAAGTIGLPTCG